MTSIRIALALSAVLAFPAAEAAAQAGPPRPPAPAPASKWKASPAMVAIVGGCYDRAAAQGTPPQALRTTVKVCVKDQIKPYRKACNKDAKAQGFVKRTVEFKEVVRGCMNAQLATAFRPAAAVQLPDSYQYTSDDEDDFFTDEE